MLIIIFSRHFFTFPRAPRAKKTVNSKRASALGGNPTAFTVREMWVPNICMYDGCIRESLSVLVDTENAVRSMPVAESEMSLVLEPRVHGDDVDHAVTWANVFLCKNNKTMRH